MRVLLFIVGLILPLPGMCFLMTGSGASSRVGLGVLILFVASLLFRSVFGKSRRPPEI